MVFASLEFLTLFLPLFFAFYLLTPQRFRNHTLLVGSWIFYAWWTPKFLILIIALTLLAWGAAILIDKTSDEKWKTRWMAWAIILNLASLVWYKYTNMLVGTLNEFLTGHQMQPVPWEHVMLPIALSFTVLHAISYLVDVRRKVVPAQYDVLAFSAYMAMFPHLIAGPIVRYKVIDKELRERVFSMEKFSLGVRRFMIGFSMKVLIADTLAPVVSLPTALWKQLGLSAGAKVRVSQGSASVVLPAREDASLAANVVRVPAGHADTAALGAMFGAIAVEAA